MLQAFIKFKRILVVTAHSAVNYKI